MGKVREISRMEFSSIQNDLPQRTELYQNWPNPFNPVTTISYSLPERSGVSLVVYNTLGQAVARLVDETEDPGSHSARFDGTRLSSGVYFYRLQAGSFVAVRRAVLLR